jgi:hypothetical protein
MAKEEPTAPKPPTQYVLGADDLRTLILGFKDAASSGSGGAGMADAMAALLKQVESLTQTAQRSVRKDNPHYEDRGVFHVDPTCEICKKHELHWIEGDPIGKEAHPRPQMIYDYIFCAGRVMADWLTIPEIELVNQFSQDKTARDGSWTATISRNGTKKRLEVSVPYRGMDARHELPSQSAILIELLYGETMADPSQALVLIQQLQAKVAALESRLAANATTA